MNYYLYFNLIAYRGIYADVIVYIFAHLHTALSTEGNILGQVQTSRIECK